MSPPPGTVTHTGAIAATAACRASCRPFGAGPQVFRCAGLWRHERPLLEVLAREYGHLPLRDLEGSYGWVLKYDQRPAALAHRIETLGGYFTNALATLGDCLAGLPRAARRLVGR